MFGSRELIVESFAATESLGPDVLHFRAMANPPQAKPGLDFNVLYLDTNVLVRSGWPSPSVGLHNTLQLANWWNVPVFLPAPVLVESEQHWIRAVQSKVTGLENAGNQLERIARPIDTHMKIQHLTIENLVKDYSTAVKAAMTKYRVEVCPFTGVPAEEMFHLAVRYVLPFEFEQEGKGFQDAVIFSSVLQHLKARGELNGILVTADATFASAKPIDVEPAIPNARLRVYDLDRTFELMWKPYYDETVTKPYAVERENAKAAAEAATPLLRKFIAANLSESMLKSGAFDKVLKLLAVGEVKVMYVQTPLPRPEEPDREVRIAIAVSADCTALVQKDYSFIHSYLKLPGEPSKPVDTEEQISWLGGVEATAKVVKREFTQLTPVSLLAVDELGSEKWWK